MAPDLAPTAPAHSCADWSLPSPGGDAAVCIVCDRACCPTCHERVLHPTLRFCRCGEHLGLPGPEPGPARWVDSGPLEYRTEHGHRTRAASLGWLTDMVDSLMFRRDGYARPRACRVCGAPMAHEPGRAMRCASCDPL